MEHNFSRIEPFTLGDNLADAWSDRRRSYEFFKTAVNYNKEDQETREALLLNVLGKTKYKDNLTFTFRPDTGGRSSIVKDVLDKFEKNYNPYCNLTLATFVFNKTLQKYSKNFDSFITEIKLQADQCEFGTAYDVM